MQQLDFVRVGGLVDASYDAMATNDSPVPAAKAAPARILIVDDSALARAVVRHRLRLAGMRVDEAGGGSEALALVATIDYDVIISDLCMPGMDGFALLESLRALAPATEVIILSGTEDLEKAMKALELGAHSYLVKPPGHPEEVLLTVKRALQTKRLRDLCARIQNQRAARQPRAVATAPSRSQARNAAAG
jgi:DNA-binding NtrC family response regulator